MKTPFSRMLYGGDYNPNQWPREVWEEDMRLFQKAGINSATVNVFSWAKLQPNEGTYDFSELDDVIDMLGRENYDIVLATSTGAMPAWLVKNYPEVARVDFEGRRHKFGQRHNHCPNSAVYQKFAGKLVEELARYAGVPVWNGLTDQFHPTQMLADLLTMEEKFGSLKGLRFTYMGDARNNMGNSLMVACAKMGIHFTACAPRELFPAAGLVETAKAIAAENHGSVRLTENVDEGAKDADIVYTDIWVSMGEPDEVWETRIRLLKPYQVNAAVMENADPEAIFMHCLPSFHDTKTTIGAEIAEKFGIPEMEVTDEVFESPRSVVFDEAENRMHTIKAVIYATLC